MTVTWTAQYVLSGLASTPADNSTTATVGEINIDRTAPQTTANGVTQTQEVSGGNGFAGQSDPRLLFGIGKVQRLVNLEPNQLHTITEGR